MVSLLPGIPEVAGEEAEAVQWEAHQEVAPRVVGEVVVRENWVAGTRQWTGRQDRSLQTSFRSIPPLQNPP